MMWRCPNCSKPIGYLGRFFQAYLGSLAPHKCLSPSSQRFARLSPDPRAVIREEAATELHALSTLELIAGATHQGDK